jgi:replicative DNA helicase
MEDPEGIDDIEIHAIDFANQLAEVVPAPRAQYFGKGAKLRKERYDRRKREGDKPGMMLGIPRYDAIMQGLQEHELLVYAGPPGSGKTTGMQHTAMNAYLQRRSSLFVSLEVGSRADPPQVRRDAVKRQLPCHEGAGNGGGG